MSRELGCRLGAVALLLGVALPACHSPPPPSAPVAAPQRPTVTATATSRPVFSLIGDRAVAPSCAEVPPGEPGALEHGFQEVALPPDTRPIVAVGGRDERDVWMLAPGDSGGLALHWDGAKLSKETVSPCTIYFSQANVVLGPDGPIARQESHQEGTTLFFAARRTPGGTWECDDGDDYTRPYPVGDQMIRVPSGGGALTLSGRRLPQPALDATKSNSNRGDVAGRFADDLWLYFPNHPEVLHYNGRVWEDRSPGVGNVHSLILDANGAAWVLTGNDARSTDGDKVLHWDHAAHAWVCLPVPAGLRTTHLRAANERDLWLLGDKELYHWDGASFQRGPTPIATLEDAWISASGELWVVGGGPADTASGQHGIVFRTQKGGEP